jgi:hypothetical protein
VKYLPLVLVATACSPPGEARFTTTCGVTYRGDATFDASLEDPTFDLEELQTSEDLAIAYGLVRCEQLKGYSVYTRPTKWQRPFLETGKNYISGLAYCNAMFGLRIEVSLTTPHVLLHEFHHAAQGCNPPMPIDDGLEYTHSNWNRSGANARIDKGYNYMFQIHFDKHNPDGGGYNVDPSEWAPTQEDYEKAE